MYQNPFNESMSHAEAREILFREIEHITDRDRFIRLQGDYAAVIPSIIRRELSGIWNNSESGPV